MSAMVLRTVENAGVLALALVAPNVVGAMGKLGILQHQRDSEMIKRAVDKLYARGYLRHEKGQLALTQSGEIFLRKLDTQFKIGIPPRQWDKKWRVLIFDIPETKRYQRDRVRTTLQSIGFEQLQQSVWIYPYDCEDWVTLWKADFKLGSELLYMIVESIEGDSALRRKFNLK